MLFSALPCAPAQAEPGSAGGYAGADPAGDVIIVVCPLEGGTAVEDQETPVRHRVPGEPQGASGEQPRGAQTGDRVRIGGVDPVPEGESGLRRRLQADLGVRQAMGKAFQCSGDSRGRRSRNPDVRIRFGVGAFPAVCVTAQARRPGGADSVAPVGIGNGAESRGGRAPRHTEADLVLQLACRHLVEVYGQNPLEDVHLSVRAVQAELIRVCPVVDCGV